MNYVVLRDGRGRGAGYYEVDSNHTKTLWKDLGEVNMGSQRALQDFLSFGKTYFPAQRYIVAFYDHGGGWQGACWDAFSFDDNLAPAEMNNALTTSGGLDIVMFTAPCLMGSVEAPYQLRSSTKYYIASEGVSGFIYWRGILAELDSFLKGNPACPTEELAGKVIALHEKYKDSSGYGPEITMSVIRMSKVGNLVSAFNDVTNYYAQHPGKFPNTLRIKVRSYLNDYCDLYGMMNAIDASESDSSGRSLLAIAENALRECVIAECHGDSTAGSNGLNIYYPNSVTAAGPYYLPYGEGLDFKDECSWGDLLVACLGKKGVASHNAVREPVMKVGGNLSIIN